MNGTGTPGADPSRDLRWRDAAHITSGPVRKCRWGITAQITPWYDDHRLAPTYADGVDRAELAMRLRRSFAEAFVDITPSPTLGPRLAERRLGHHAGWRWLRDAFPWIVAFAVFWIAVASLDGTLDLPRPLVVLVSVVVALPIGLLGGYALVGWRVATGAAVLMALGAAAGLVIPQGTEQARWPVVGALVWMATLLVVSARHDRWVVAWTWLATIAVLSTRLGDPTTIVWIVAASVVVLIGDLLRTRHLAGRALAEQTELSDLEKARRVVLEERTRIARDLHDVVAHHMSMVVVQAESAPYRLDSLTEPAKAEFASISGSARAALNEIRALLGVLRNDDGVATAPQPGLADIERLVDSAVRAGAPVRLSMHGDMTAVLRPTVGLSAYRIVQECLANAARHSPGADVQVGIRSDADAVLVEVSNAPSPHPPPPSPPGHGLAGMRERAAVVGGTLTAGPRSDGGFAVTATLPLTRAVATTSAETA